MGNHQLNGRRNRTRISVLSAFLLVLSAGFAHCQVNTKPGEGAADIRINQLGYYPDGPRKVAIVNTSSRIWTLLDTLGKRVYSGKLKPAGYCDKSGDTVKYADMMYFSTPGIYQLYIPGKGCSQKFEIKPNLYREALRASLKSFYFQRASIPLEEKYAGIYARPAGHPDDKCYFHPSTGKTWGTKPSPGGWYDAGDYNKYIVNSSITVSMMLSLAELCPAAIPDGFCNIPESGNGVSDLLDEVRYNLNWMLTMQDEDGGVFHKLTDLGFGGFELPHKSKEKRYFVGKSTTASLCFSASMAQASRLYRPYDPAFADRMLLAAQRAYQWALDNPDKFFSNPPDVYTGTYADQEADDEFFWAAAELFRTTGDPNYRFGYRKYRKPIAFQPTENWRLYLQNLGYYTLILDKQNIPAEERAVLKKEMLACADSLGQLMSVLPYRIPLTVFEWGSNSDILDAAMLFAVAYNQTKEKKYLNAMVETTDYIFGKNATGYSFVTGFGSKTPLNPHHRLSGGDGIAAPIPGFVVGGPNVVRQDAGNGAQYSSKYPMKSYTDQLASYASNEICINWNAPLVFVLGFLETRLSQ
jgi:endoglucanase